MKNSYHFLIYMLKIRRFNTDFGPLKQATLSDCSVSLNSEQKATNSPDLVTQIEPSVLNLRGLCPVLATRDWELRSHHISTVQFNWKEPTHSSAGVLP